MGSTRLPFCSHNYTCWIGSSNLGCVSIAGNDGPYVVSLSVSLSLCPFLILDISCGTKGLGTTGESGNFTAMHKPMGIHGHGR